MTAMYSTELNAVCLHWAGTLGTKQLNGHGQEVKS